MQEGDALCKELCQAILYHDHDKVFSLIARGAPSVSANYNASYTMFACMGYLPTNENERAFYWWLHKRNPGTAWDFYNSALTRYAANVRAARAATVAWLGCASRRRRTPFSRDLDAHLARVIWSTHDEEGWGE